MATTVKLPNGTTQTTSDYGQLDRWTKAGAQITGGQFPPEFQQYASDSANLTNGTPRAPEAPTLTSVLQGPSDNPTLSSDLMIGGPAWVKMMKDQIANQKVGAKDSLNKQSSSNYAQGQSSLASTGGLSNSARERLAKSTLSDKLNQGQNLENQFRGQNIGVDVADQANKSQNIKNILTQKAVEDAAKLGKYGEQMKGFGASQTANATAASGGGGFLGTWFCSKSNELEEMTPDDWSFLKRLRRFTVKHEIDSSIFYYAECGKLVEKLKEAKFDFSEFVPFTRSVINLVKLGATKEASDLYKGKTIELVKTYWKDCESVYFKKMCNEAEVEVA